MPFGMGRAGWLMWPYFTQWPGYWLPSVAPYVPPHSHSSVGKEEMVAYLQERAKMLKREYDWINSRLREIQEIK